MKKYQDLAILLVRLTIASGFLSAVASRLGIWGKQASGWTNFIKYTEELNFFVPSVMVPFLAVTSTLLEVFFAVLLLIGYQTRRAAMGAAMLTGVFAITMTCAFGCKEPLDYSVFVFSAAAFLLACAPDYRWSIDNLLLK